MEENIAFGLPELPLEIYESPGSILCSRTKQDLHGDSSLKVVSCMSFLVWFCLASLLELLLHDGGKQ